MPFVSIRLVDTPTLEQKQQVIAEITDVLVRVLGKNPATTMIVIEEFDTDNWGVGGETVTVRRAKAKV